MPRLSWLVSLAVLAGVTANEECEATQYWSWNQNICVPRKALGEYCNVVQTCAADHSCTNEVCVVMAVGLESAGAFYDEATTLCEPKMSPRGSVYNTLLAQPADLYSVNGLLEVDLDLDWYPYEDNYFTCPMGLIQFNGGFPAATWHVKQGDKLIIHYHNKLTKDNPDDWTDRANNFAFPHRTNLHLHGLHIESELHDHETGEMWYLEGGESRTMEVTIPLDHMPGHHWYHPHHHGSSGLQMFGSHGSLFIETNTEGSAENKALGPDLSDVRYLEQMRKVTMSITSGSFDSSSMLGFNDFNKLFTNLNMEDHKCFAKPHTKFIHTNTGAFEGKPYKMVNGQVFPHIQVQANEPVLLQILGSDWALESILSFEDNTVTKCELFLMSKDGIPISDAPRKINYNNIVPGSRAGIVLLCSGEGTVTVLDDKLLGGTRVFEIRVQGGTKTGPLATTAEAMLTLSGSLEPTMPRYLTNLCELSQDQIDYENDVQMLIFAGTENYRVENYCDFEQQMIGVNNPTQTAPIGPFYHTINRKLFDHHHPISETFAGEKIIETTFLGPQSHPYHQHTNPFQVCTTFDDWKHPNDEFYQGWYKKGDWHDVINILTFEFSTFSKYTWPWPFIKLRWGTYDFYGGDGKREIMVQHCHRFWHEDSGMMGAYEIVAPEAATPVPVPLAHPVGYEGKYIGEPPADCVADGSVDVPDCSNYDAPWMSECGVNYPPSCYSLTLSNGIGPLKPVCEEGVMTSPIFD